MVFSSLRNLPLLPFDQVVVVLVSIALGQRLQLKLGQWLKSVQVFYAVPVNGSEKLKVWIDES